MRKRNRMIEVNYWISSNRPMFFQFEDWTTKKTRSHKLHKDDALKLINSGFWVYNEDYLPSSDYIVRFVPKNGIRHLQFLEIRRNET